VARRPHTAEQVVFDHPCALPQRDRPARPPLTGGAVGRHRDLIVFDAGNVLHDGVAVGRPCVDAKGKMRSRYRHLSLPQSSSAASRFSAGALGFFSTMSPGFSM